jgi:hypothetical protein
MDVERHVSRVRSRRHSSSDVGAQFASAEPVTLDENSTIHSIGEVDLGASNIEDDFAVTGLSSESYTKLATEMSGYLLWDTSLYDFNLEDRVDGASQPQI